MKKSVLKISNVVPVIFLVICFLFSAYLAFDASKNTIDSDASSELVLSNILSKENSILSKDWHYSTELRVLSTQLVYAPLFKIFTDWGTVRFLGTIILQCVLVLSYFYLMIQAKVKLKYIFYTAGLLLVPISVAYARIVLYQCFYIPHIALSFLSVGLFFSIINNKNTSKARNWARIIIFLALNLVGGLGGFRQLLITQTPLLVACLIVALKSESFSQLVSIINQPGIRNKKNEIKELMQTTEGRGFFLSITSIFFTGIGFLINSLVLLRVYSFVDYGNTTPLINPKFSFLDTQFASVLHLFGFKSGSQPATIEGLFSVAGILCLAITICLLVYLFRSSTKIKSYAVRIVPPFLTVAFVVNSIVFLLVGDVEFHSIYYIPIFIYVIPLMAILLNQHDLKWSLLCRRAIIFMFIIFFVNGGITLNYLLNKPSDSTLTYEGSVYQNVNCVDEISGAVKFLEENDYSFGYATFWNSNIVTELTNGKIRSVNLDGLPDDVVYFNWLTVKEYQQSDYYTGKVYILLTDSEATESEGIELINSGEVVYQDQYYTIYHYEDNQYIYNYLNAASKSSEE